MPSAKSSQLHLQQGLQGHLPPGLQLHLPDEVSDEGVRPEFLLSAQVSQLLQEALPEGAEELLRLVSFSNEPLPPGS
jgi:hypothetical protein